MSRSGPDTTAPAVPPPPMALLAELTHRCPLQCPYCSNPLEMVRRSGELSTEDWSRVYREAAELGVLHVHLSGGEPASRRDLAELTSAAAAAGLYTNLITSGIGLTEVRIMDLSERGLDHIQLSIQGTNPKISDKVSGYKGSFERKIKVAGWIGAANLPLTLNAVMHRGNLDQLPETIDLALRLGARRLEVAQTQYHGWALKNRAALMPTRKQLADAVDTVEAARERLRGVLVIDHVLTDHHTRFPKACMGGWGRIGLNVTPSGKVLPCHAAETIPHLSFETVHDRPLAEIWSDGAAFNAYRGTGWMSEPCRSCERREVDFGGCRCQAMAYAGDAGATDPACEKSPLHGTIAAIATLEADADPPDYVYRKI